jgi:hypothetical protein
LSTASVADKSTSLASSPGFDSFKSTEHVIGADEHFCLKSKMLSASHDDLYVGDENFPNSLSNDGTKRGRKQTNQSS